METTEQRLSHLIRIVMALIQITETKELRIPLPELERVRNGVGLIESVDQGTHEVVLRYAGEGAQVFFAGGQPWSPSRQSSTQQDHPNPSQVLSAVMNDTELALREDRQLRNSVLRNQAEQRKQRAGQPLNFSTTLEKDFAP